MKSLKTIPALILIIISLQSNAQTEAPKGFRKGTIILVDSSSVSGYIKDNIRGNASVTLINETGDKKKNYDGSEIISVEIEGIKFICIKGDFFKVISKGELNFLQKSSDASNKPSYNGNETIFSNGTEGKPGDYFIYDNKNKQLSLVSKKNFNTVITTSFADNNAALEKARTINGDIPQLKEAIEIYNIAKAK